MAPEPTTTEGGKGEVAARREAGAQPPSGAWNNRSWGSRSWGSRSWDNRSWDMRR